MGSATSSRFGSQPGVYWYVSWSDGGRTFNITGYNETFEQWDGSYAYYNLNATFYVSVSVGGYSGTATISSSGRNASFSGSATINGTPSSSSSITFTVTGTTESSGKGTFYGTYSVSSSTSVSCASSVNLGNSLAIYLSNSSGVSNYSHNLYYVIGSSEYSIATGISSSSYSWDTSAMQSRMTTVMSLGTRIRCKTYKNGTLIGTSDSNNVTVNVPSYTISNTISLIIARVNSNTTVAGWNIFLQGYTKLKINNLSASSSYGASITSYSYSDTASNTYTSSSAVTNYTFPDVISSAGTITITVAIVDSRGVRGSATGTYTVYEYSPPYLQDVQAFRSNSSGIPANDGTYFHYEATAGISSCNNHNSISSLVVSYKAKSASSYTQVASVSTSTVQGTQSGIDPTISYTVRFVITDQLTSYTYERSIATKGIPFNLGRGGSSAAFGAFASVPNALEIGGGWTLVLNDTSLYGTTLPASGVEGQIFFKTTS